MKQFNSLLELTKYFSTEESCVQYFTDIRWKDGVFCPHCGNKTKNIYKFADNKRYKCGACLQQFTVRVGTIFEDSKLPLQKWLIAFWLVTNHKKGGSSLQLSRDISVTQKTAWFMLQCIQFLAHQKILIHH